MKRLFSAMGKGLLWLLILALLVLPLGLIYEISNREKAVYATPTAPAFVETAYGPVIDAQRMDIQESILLSGTFCPRTYEYIELKQQEPSKIRWNIGIGDEIQEGQVLGTYQGDDVTAPISGLVTEMNAYTPGDAYLKVQLSAPLLLECDVSQKNLIALKYATDLKTEDGEAVTVDYIANIRNADGTTHVRLSIDSDAYFLNQVVEDMKIHTGGVYQQALVLPESCVYQRVPGEDNPWYVRQVTEFGQFVREVEVGRGFSDGEMVCVTGVNVGEWFDSGYKAIAGGNSE